MHVATEIQIDPEFQSLIPPLTPEEYNQLEINIITEGCRDALVVWTDKTDCPECGETCQCEGDVPCPHCGAFFEYPAPILVDGHNRYQICTKHGLSFDVVKKEFADREAVKDWMDANQLGRRNLTPEAVSLLRGRRYNRVKKVVPNQDGINQYAEVNPQNEDKPKTSELLAEQYGVSHATIERDGQFADAVEALKPTVPDIEQRVLAGDVPSKKAVVEASREPGKAQEILFKPHVANNSGNNEWYTPRVFIDKARSVMGGIDLDPASSEQANRVVGAKKIYTASDDGLTQVWFGNVWLNPPYAQPLVSQFSQKLAADYRTNKVFQACLLVNNATETKWFQEVGRVADAICFPLGRIKYLDESLEAKNQPLQGQACLYFGENTDEFSAEFGELGLVVRV